jgi:hypothetical protein
MTQLINEDQTGYIKNRFIGFNLRQIQDIIDYADIYKIEGSLVFIVISTDSTNRRADKGHP